MSLSDAQRTRYARHLLLPELAEAGQERLLTGHVHFAADADEGAKAVARDYLARAGVAENGADAVWVALPSAPGIEALAGTPELTEAARVLAGAFAAVEAIKALAGLGTKGALDEGWSLSASSAADAREQDVEARGVAREQDSEEV